MSDSSSPEAVSHELDWEVNINSGRSSEAQSSEDERDYEADAVEREYEGTPLSSFNLMEQFVATGKEQVGSKVWKEIEEDSLQEAEEAEGVVDHEESKDPSESSDQSIRSPHEPGANEPSLSPSLDLDEASAHSIASPIHRPPSLLVESNTPPDFDRLQQLKPRSASLASNLSSSSSSSSSSSLASRRLACSCCHESFSSHAPIDACEEDRRPRFLETCGCFLCAHCVEQALQHAHSHSIQFKCPLDGTRYEFAQVNDVPIHQSAIELLSKLDDLVEFKCALANDLKSSVSDVSIEATPNADPMVKHDSASIGTNECNQTPCEVDDEAGICGECNSPALWFCARCDANLCDAHIKSKLQQRHWYEKLIMTIATKPKFLSNRPPTSSLCALHLLPESLYCPLCQTATCQTCSMHGSHESHSNLITSIRAVTEQNKARLQQVLQIPTADLVRDQLESVRHADRDVKEFEVATLNSIEEEFARLVERLMVRKSQLTREVAEKAEMLRAAHAHSSHQLSQLLNRLTLARSMASCLTALPLRSFPALQLQSAVLGALESTQTELHHMQSTQDHMHVRGQYMSNFKPLMKEVLKFGCVPDLIHSFASDSEDGFYAAFGPLDWQSQILTFHTQVRAIENLIDPIQTVVPLVASSTDDPPQSTDSRLPTSDAIHQQSEEQKEPHKEAAEHLHELSQSNEVKAVPPLASPSVSTSSSPAASISFKLLYRASRDGFSAASFHAHCDRQGSTLIVARCKETSRVFGAMAVVEHESCDAGAHFIDPTGLSFLFTFDPADPSRAYALPCVEHERAMYCKTSLGPNLSRDLQFGEKMDEANANKCEPTSYASKELVMTDVNGNMHSAPQVRYDSTFLTGASIWSASEIEVFSIRPTGLIRLLHSSTILRLMDLSALKRFCGDDIRIGEPTLLYRASRDGFYAQDFRRQVHGMQLGKPTLTLVKVAGSSYVFGAYTQSSWPNVPQGRPFFPVRDPTGRSFLFSLVNAHGRAMKLKQKDAGNAVAYVSHMHHGPVLGGGADADDLSPDLIFGVRDDSNPNKHATLPFDAPESNCMNSPRCFELDESVELQSHLPSLASAGIRYDRRLLAGTARFALLEMEVYSIA